MDTHNFFNGLSTEFDGIIKNDVKYKYLKNKCNKLRK